MAKSPNPCLESQLSSYEISPMNFYINFNSKESFISSERHYNLFPAHVPSSDVTELKLKTFVFVYIYFAGNSKLKVGREIQSLFMFFKKILRVPPAI